MNTLTPPVRMNFSGGAIAQSWSRWEREFRTFFAACELYAMGSETVHAHAVRNKFGKRSHAEEK